MRRLIVLLLLLVATVARAGEECEFWLPQRWNTFFKSAHTFAELVNAGHGFDLKLQKKLSEQWRSIERCGCWPEAK